MTAKSRSGWIVRFAGAPVDRSICWRTNHLGVQDANDNRPINDRGRIYSALHEPKGGHPFDGHPQGSAQK